MTKHHTLPVAVFTMFAIATSGVTGAAEARAKHVKPKEGTTTIHRQRGADGLTDAMITGPHGGVTTVDRSKGADGLVDKTVTGPKGGVTTVDRARNADRTVDTTITKAGH